MARRKISKKRVTYPDPMYNSQLVGKLIKKLMKCGEKSKAGSICYDSFAIIEKKAKQNPLQVFLKAMDNVKPALEVRSRRVGGATYQVPTTVEAGRQETLALRWIVQFATQKKGKPMKQRLAEEIMMAFRGEGLAVKKKDDTHRMAEANRAFAHYRW